MKVKACGICQTDLKIIRGAIPLPIVTLPHVLGHEVVVANPRRVRLIAESDAKSDRFDAELLARLGRRSEALRQYKECVAALARELDALHKGLKHPERPMLAIVGGSKVSTKLTVLEALMSKVDELIVGGGIASSALGIALAREGVNVAIAERAPVFEDRVRGEWLAPWGVAEARKLNLLPIFEEIGLEVDAEDDDDTTLWA